MIRKRLKVAMMFGFVGALVFAISSVFAFQYPTGFSSTSGGEILIFVSGIILTYLIVFVIFDIAGFLHEWNRRRSRESTKRPGGSIGHENMKV